MTTAFSERALALIAVADLREQADEGVMCLTRRLIGRKEELARLTSLVRGVEAKLSEQIAKRDGECVAQKALREEI